MPLLFDVIDAYNCELEELIQELVDDEGLSEDEAHSKARRLLRKNRKKVLKITYANFLEASALMKKSPLHAKVMEVIREYKDAGKSFHKAMRLSMADHEGLLEKLLGDESDESTDEESDAEKE
jgi:hypothetical protein